MNMAAPVALFVYRRRALTERTVRFLAANRRAAETPLTIFSDGAKGPEDASAVAEVRAYLGQIAGFRSVEIVEAPVNRGLANSIIAGVTQMCERFGRVIVLEDDMETAPGFLEFMNDALERFAGNDRIASIHAYTAPSRISEVAYFLRRGADCWGWATWARGWRGFNPDAAALARELKARKLTREFDVENAFPFTRMLADQAAGKLDSWAIRFQAATFLAGQYTLQSNLPLVRNIGFGPGATHCGAGKNEEFPLFPGTVEWTQPPEPETPELRAEYRRTLRSLRPTFAARAVEWLKRKLTATAPVVPPK